MSKAKASATSRRRDFLKFATLGTLAGAAAVAAKPGTANAGTDLKDDTRSSGYRETEHVKKVYELSKF